MSAWRHARAIALLPGTVAVLIPALILVNHGSEITWWRALLAAPLLAAGFALWAWTVRLFATIGVGTLAPWDPTEKLVVQGPYSHVRNPMIIPVCAFLLAEAILFGSLGNLIELAAFIAVNQAFFLLYEEPALERRFGEQYRRYKATMPRWIPRARGPR